MSFNFYVGLHMVNHCQHFERSFVSINRLRNRVSDFTPKRWILDCAGFSEISLYQRHRLTVREYARLIDRWARCGQLERAVSQDWMCEAHILRLTGRTVLDHQKLTVRAYRELMKQSCHPIMPVLQGYTIEEYLNCLDLYGSSLIARVWIGVGSVCKRNREPAQVLEILSAIKEARPDLRLHGFGLKITALAHPGIKRLLAKRYEAKVKLLLS